MTPVKKKKKIKIKSFHGQLENSSRIGVLNDLDRPNSHFLSYSLIVFFPDK